jgi:hypothetical protein
VILEPSFLDHWKIKLLVKRTGNPAAPVAILRLWIHCQRMRKCEFQLSPDALATICDWSENSDDFLSLLLELRFLEQHGDYYIVRNFDKWNAKLISCWDNGGKGGRKRRRKTQTQIGFLSQKPKVGFGKPTPSSLSNLSSLSDNGESEGKPPNLVPTAEDIYNAYPRKVGKPAAIRAIRAVVYRFGAANVLERTIAYCKTQSPGDNFTPYPATWFNQHRFNDDPATWIRTERPVSARHETVEEARKRKEKEHLKAFYEKTQGRTTDC